MRALRLLVEKLERRKYGAPRATAPTTVTPTPQAPEARESVKPASVVPESKKHTHAPRQRVLPPAAVRRDVRDRDGNRCTFVDDRGQRCREPRFLQQHHVHAHAKGGDASAGNLTQRCQAHNTLAAEQDFGLRYARNRRRHGPCTAHPPRNTLPRARKERRSAVLLAARLAAAAAATHLPSASHAFDCRQFTFAVIAGCSVASRRATVTVPG